jgi:pentatricopeptide repeat protein
MRLKRALNSQLLGMTSKTEQDYFTRYGREIYTGAGEVVDLGCWLGSTTIPLVEGLLKNPAFAEGSKKVFAYDLFIWFEWMNESTAGTNLSGKYKEGDNFVAEFEKRTVKYSSRIEICAGDLVRLGWNGKPIEFLLIDAMKTWELANGIVRHFYPALIPQSGMILHQDFAHHFAPWIHLLQWKFRECFEFVEEIPRSSSLVFKLTKPIPAEFLTATYSFDSFSDEEVNEAFDYSIKLVSSEKLPNVAAAKVMWYIHQKKFEKARAVWQELLAQGVPPEGHMLVVSEMIGSVVS